MKLKSLGVKAACLTVGVALLTANFGFATTGSANNKLGRATVVSTVNSKNLGVAKAPTTTPTVLVVAEAVAYILIFVVDQGSSHYISVSEGAAAKYHTSSEAALHTLD